MPIQWSGTIDSPAKLASVIQGEAGSNPVAQFAVASTMWNRMSNFGPYLGGGSMDVASVVTPSQFNGFNSSPNSTAQGFANDLWGGNAPQGGDTGNATFFAAPSNSNASWANPNTASGAGLFSNGANIGGNYFTDQLGPPSNNFQPPVYGAASSPSYAMPDFTSGDPYWSNQGAANIAPTATDATGSFNGAGGLPFFAQGGGGTTTPDAATAFNAGNSPDGGVSGAANPVDYGAAGAPSSLGSLGGAASSPFDAGNSPSGGLTGAQQTAANGSPAPWEMFGVPAVKSAGAAVSKAVTDSFAATTKAALSSGTTWLNATLDSVKNIFVRGTIGLLAILLILSALFLMRPREA